MTSSLRVWSAKKSFLCETSTSFDTLKLQIDDFLRRCLVKPTCQNSFATSSNAAPATKINDPLAQVLCLPGKTDAASWDTLLKYCACHAKRKARSQKMSQKATKPYYLRWNRPPTNDFVAFRERRPTVRLSDLKTVACELLRTPKQHWANTTPTSRPPELNKNPSLLIYYAFGKNSIP